MAEEKKEYEIIETDINNESITIEYNNRYYYQQYLEHFIEDNLFHNPLTDIENLKKYIVNNEYTDWEVKYIDLNQVFNQIELILIWKIENIYDYIEFRIVIDESIEFLNS